MSAASSAICRTETLAEFTRDQTGVEPGHKGVDTENRETQALRQGAGVGHHIGAFEKHRANAVVNCDEPVAGGKYIALGPGDIEPLLVVEHDTAELGAVIGADYRCGRISTRGPEVLGGQVRRAHG